MYTFILFIKTNFFVNPNYKNKIEKALGPRLSKLPFGTGCLVQFDGEITKIIPKTKTL